MSARRSHGTWDRTSVLASLTISGAWHLLVLAILALAIHPFQLPMQDAPPIELQLTPRLPDFTRPKPEPKPEPVLKRAPTPAEPPLERVHPEDQTLETPAPTARPQEQPSPLVEVARPQAAALDKPTEVARQQAAAKRRLDASRKPLDLPPAPLDETRPNAPALPKPVEVIRTAPARAPALDLRRLPPSLPTEAANTPAPPTAAAKPEAEAPAPAQVQVLTNQQTIQSPVEIRPRERAAAAPLVTGGAPALPDLRPSSGGEPAAGGGVASGGGALGGGPRTGPNGSVIGGFDAGALKGGGLRMRLGCESPDTYKLSVDERAACLERLASGARGAGDLGLKISGDKEAAYDHYVACQVAYHRAPLPGSHSASEGTSINGMGNNPTLKACGPGTR